MNTKSHHQRTVDGHAYCPYLGATVPIDSMNSEHVIPLALGGCDAFTLLADRDINSALGSTIDGKLANDFFMAQRRNLFDARGHSGERPVPTYKKAAIEGHPVQVEIDRFEKALRVYSPRARRYLTDDEQAGARIEFSVNIDVDLHLRFVAKVALAAGYLAYGNAFIDAVAHEDLRSMMNNDYAKLDDDAMKQVDIYAADMLRPPTGANTRWLYAGSETLGRAVVLLVPRSTRLEIAVGCLGRFIGFVSVRADTTRLPNDGAYSLGHVFAVSANGTLNRGSWASALTALERMIEDLKAKQTGKSE